MVLDFFTRVAEPPIPDYSSELESATCSPDPVVSSVMSDIWRATLRRGTHVAVKCVRTALSGNENALKASMECLGLFNVSKVTHHPCPKTAHSERTLFLVSAGTREHTEATRNSTVQGSVGDGVRMDGSRERRCSGK